MGGFWEMSAWQIMQAGGPIMWPLLLCSLFSVTLFVEKMIYFSKIKTDVNQLKKNVFTRIKNNKIKEAIQICDSNNSPTAKILKAGITKFGATKEEIKETLEDASLFEIPKLEKRLSGIATIAHISPLLGLLGTVTGMTSSFHTIQIRAASLNPVTPGDLAGGISEALITTVAGLIIAIPTFVAYNYLVHRINEFVLEMERAATELINFMGQITAAKEI